MAALKKYMFDLDFDAQAPEPEPAPMPDASAEGEMPVEEAPPITYSEFEMEEAKRIAQAEGRDLGVKEATELTERKQAEALGALAQGMKAISDAQREANDALRREAVHLALAVVKKMQPEFARLHGLDEIAGVIRECLGQIDDMARLTVRCHPDLLDGVRERAHRVAQEAEFEGKIVFAADPKLAIGDCRVEWGDGGADRDQTLIAAEIEGIVARAIDGLRGAAATPAAR